MELFTVLPERFFSVLAGPLKEDYAAVLFRIYDQYQLTTSGIAREVVLDLIVDYMEQKNQFFEQELAEELQASSDAPVGSRERAALILRRLERAGWVTGEIYSNYAQYISLPDYAIKMLDALDKIRRQRQGEYQGFVYATYSLLYSAEADLQGNLALEKACEQTEQLINGLKSLSHNIKRYIERVLAEKEPREILKIHFQEYLTEIIDRNYHRLKTSDNVSRYRPRIIARLNEWYGDPHWVERAAVLEAQRSPEMDLYAARREIYRRLDYIRQAYSDLDALLEEIDRRNARYAGASFQQLKYILNSSRDLAGQLTGILKYLAGLRAGEGRSADDYLPDGTDRLFSFFTRKSFSMDSLFTGPETARRHRAQEVAEPTAVDPARRLECLRRFRRRMDGRMTREKINAWVMEQLARKGEVRARELHIADLEDFIKLIYASAYSRSPRVTYRVERGDGPVVTAAEGRFEFKDLSFKRK